MRNTAHPLDKIIEEFDVVKKPILIFDCFLGALLIGTLAVTCTLHFFPQINPDITLKVLIRVSLVALPVLFMAIIISEVFRGIFAGFMVLVWSDFGHVLVANFDTFWEVIILRMFPISEISSFSATLLATQYAR